ncbi:peptidylprolyl isomerase [Shewanella sedimentimangrovi]|uniref:Peptidyl-prolyl cis-trans isomerase n=1 Tax=Shewanella sedimentimangrovi TaxID=2814293 RepID=A0ABX7R331_9GAMM|nr:peptidylprolyl isomerase [Shewanella sedimentimangrovi]QSX38234.1 peptidylprolyl isomerase [Shewanella sedimentimangrovi]
MKRIIGLALSVNLVACGGGSDSPAPEVPETPAVFKADACYLMSTNMGDIELAIDMTNTPLSGKNFKQYVDKGFYNGTLFHRAVNNFVIQGGGFTTGLQAKATDSPIKNEARVGFSNDRGTLAMARTSAPDSATSQFFINVLDNPQLDYSASNYGYAVFGKVISGMEVVDQISITPVHSVNGFSNVPVDDVLIESVTEMNCPAL